MSTPKRHITKSGLFPTRQMANNPRVIVTTQNKHGKDQWDEKRIEGKFFQVSPSCPREIFALQWLEHQKDKFAPAVDVGGFSGCGVIVSAAALARLDA